MFHSSDWGWVCICLYRGINEQGSAHQVSVSSSRPSGDPVTNTLRLQGEKLSSAALFTLLQIALALTLGFNIPSDLFQLAVFLPNSRYH